MSAKDAMALWEQRRKERREYLNAQYPNRLIQKIDIEHLRKIGYAIGIGSTYTKKEFIDRMIERQIGRNNPIIIRNSDGEYLLNREVDLLDYIVNY